MTEHLRRHLLSIGALARAVGVPVETLRTWERRYGFPTSERTASGHRRYSLATIERLRLVRAAIVDGHRASVALRASEPELRLLLPAGRVATPAPAPDVPEALPRPLDPVEVWLELIERFDGGALESELRGSLASLGALTFLQRRIAPLIHALGERWSAAEIGIRHEHFASARIQEFLARHWQPLSDAASGPTAVCATLQGERHTLGLHMAAFTLALNNLRIVFLGADLPATEIAEAAAQHAASAVVLSAARGVDREGLERDCAALRLAIGLDIPIVAGGAGFDPFPTTVLGFYDLSALDEWARGQAASSWLPRVARTYS